MRRLALPLVAAGTLAIVAGYVLAFVPAATVIAPWAMATGIAILCPALAALGAGDVRRPRFLTTALALLGISLLAGFAVALGPVRAPLGPGASMEPGAAPVAPDPTAVPGNPGFPGRTLGLLLVVGVIPLIALPAVYALTFPATRDER